jgi:hypothetical protein
MPKRQKQQKWRTHEETAASGASKRPAQAVHRNRPSARMRWGQGAVRGKAEAHRNCKAVGSLKGPEKAVKCLALTAGILSAVFGVASTIFLVKGTAHVPPDRWSFNGQSEWEIAFRETARRWLVAGFCALGGAFILSAVSALASYMS